MFCPNCGTKNDDDALFCGSCGTKLQDKAVVPPIDNDFKPDVYKRQVIWGSLSLLIRTIIWSRMI